MRFLFSFFSFFLFLHTQGQDLDWSISPTGENMTVLVNVTAEPTILGSPLAIGDSIGVFFLDNGELRIGGGIAWSGTVAPISFPAYEDDNSTSALEGFEAGDTLIWRVKDISENIDYTASVVYLTTVPFQNTYAADGFIGVSSILIDATAIEGCTDPAYLEYDATANVDDGSCNTLIVLGCTDNTFVEYNPNANVDDGSCATIAVEGCTDSLYIEYNPSANVDDGSCATLIVIGCTDPDYLEFDPLANTDDGSCVTLAVEGCMDSTFVEYNPAANIDDGSCQTLKIFGCIDPAYMEYDPVANTDDGSCITLIVAGCMDEYAQNFNPTANTDDGMCDYTCPGTTVQIRIVAYPNPDSFSQYFLSKNGVVFLQIFEDDFAGKDSLVVHQCVESGSVIAFSGQGLSSWSVQNCGVYMSPLPGNPSQTSFTALCNNTSVTENDLGIVWQQMANYIVLQTEQNTHYTVTDALGKVWSSGNLEAGNSAEIFLNDLPSGIFYLSLRTTLGSITLPFSR